MPRIRKLRKVDTYQICVTIIEAKYLEPNANPMVVVRLGNRKKKTVIRGASDNPYYNEYFVFDLTCNMDELLNTRMEIAVYLCGRLKRCKFHGNIVFEVATVWDQPEHQYYHKWAMLTNPRDLTSGPKGFVKCNIAVHAKGEKFKIPAESDGEDDIEGNLLLPLGDSRRFATRQRARYIFTLHRAEDLPDKAASSGSYVRVSFAGMKAETSCVDCSISPSFDERIVFKEMFPPLSHRARIALRTTKGGVRRCGGAIATYVLNFTTISNSEEYGFLPTFGPSFLHLYADAADPTVPIYRGRLLLSVRTELERTEGTGTVGAYVESAPSIVEGSLWNRDQYLLVCVLYDVCMIDRSLLSSGKRVSFELSLGNAGNQSMTSHQRFCQLCRDDDEEEDEDESCEHLHGCASVDSRSTTEAETVVSLDAKYNCVLYGSKKPCIFVKSYWPDTEWRTRSSNRLSSIADTLEAELERLETLAAAEQESAYAEYNKAIRAFKSSCAEYLQSLKDLAIICQKEQDLVCATPLDRHRINQSKVEVEAVLEKIKANGELPDNRFLKIAMIHAFGHLKTIRKLSEDPQHSLPDVFLWMLSGSRKLAYARLPASRLIFAEEQSERGSSCGQWFTLFFDRPKMIDDPTMIPHRAACKSDVFLWLGSSAYVKNCWAAIPPGYVSEEGVKKGEDVFPEVFDYRKSSKFQLRAHIFQGRFEPGMDSSGLLDPLLRVIFQGYTMATRVIKQTLDPIWDQTLVFPPIDIHGMRDYVKNHPPNIVFEAFDRDFLNKLELYGRCVAAPLVKLNTETYSPPDFPAKLRWYNFSGQGDYSGAVLVALELIEIGDSQISDVPLDIPDEFSEEVLHVPEGIRPRMASYRLEIVFWGVRDVRRVNLLAVRRPKIVVECGGVYVESEVMENAKKFPNFKETHLTVDMEMPEDVNYYPPVTIKAYDSRGLGYLKYVGVCNVPTIHVFMHPLITKIEYEKAIYHSASQFQPSAHYSVPVEFPAVGKKYPESTFDSDDIAKAEASAQLSYKRLSGSAGHFLKRLLRWRNDGQEQAWLAAPPPPAANDEDESGDWWSKYYSSFEEIKIHDHGLAPNPHSSILFPGRIKVYPAELEAQPEFSGFQDRLRTFELKRGKKVAGEKYDEKHYAGKFKGYIATYRWPHPDGAVCVNPAGKSLSYGLCSDYPSHEPLQLIVRLYAVKAINLRPTDPLTGKADPYLLIKLGKNSINERKNYIPNQLNPTFGKVYEMEASFPKDYTMLIQVWDYDATSSDDLIGETRVDIESRFYSRHRAHCGLASQYESGGPCPWRDRERPEQILRQLCLKNNLPQPEFLDDSVKIGKRKFPYPKQTEDDPDREESMALSVLHRWRDFPICGCALVPEHVERRSLFNPKRPGLEQGRLEMWIDMFPIDELPPKPPTNIRPQPPQDYELRVTVFNTENVPLVDNQFLTGQKCSDIYVKGWLLPEDKQKTDVHYNSLTGEGNFNWRFVYRFTYAAAERMMVVSRKANVFALSETEQKMPCRLNLQVWDSDHFSKDDFLGALSLDLPHMPRGASSAHTCTLKLLDPRYPKVNLFKVGKTKAWWPLTTNTALGHYIRAGKIEMELAVLTAEEADNKPVGKGHEPPEPLPKPKRPDTSFSWFRNPWKACCFVVFRFYRWRLLACCCCLLMVLFVALGIYAFPGYFIKRVLGA